MTLSVPFSTVDFCCTKKEFIAVSSARNTESCLANLIGRRIIASLLQNKYNVNEPVVLFFHEWKNGVEKYKQQPRTHIHTHHS